MLHGQALRDVNPQHKKLIRLLVLAYRAWAKPTLGSEDIDEGHAHMLSYCKELVDLYGPSIGTINMHLACHLKDCMLAYGPFHAFSLFAFERCNGIVGAMNINGRNPEVTFMAKVCEMHALGRDNILRPGMDPRSRVVVRSALGMASAGRPAAEDSDSDSDDEMEDCSHVRTCGAIVMDWAFDAKTSVCACQGVARWFGVSRLVTTDWDPGTMSAQLRGHAETKHGSCLLADTGTKFRRLAICGLRYGSAIGSYRDMKRADVLTLAAPEVGEYTVRKTVPKRPWCARVEYYVALDVWVPKENGGTAADLALAVRSRCDCKSQDEWECTLRLRLKCFNQQATSHLFACLQWYVHQPSPLTTPEDLRIMEDYLWENKFVTTTSKPNSPVQALVPVQRIIGGFSRWKCGGDGVTFRAVPLPSHVL